MQGRWHTPFGRWVRDYGAVRLAADVGRSLYGTPLTPETVYQWVAGRHPPRPANALRIVQLAQGRVTLEDIYAQRTRAAPHPTP